MTFLAVLAKIITVSWVLVALWFTKYINRPEFNSPIIYTAISSGVTLFYGALCFVVWSYI